MAQFLSIKWIHLLEIFLFFLFLLRQGTVGVHSEHGQSPHTQPGPQLDRPHSWRSLWRAVQACEAGHDLQQAPDPASRSPLCKVPLKLCLLCFSKKCLSGNIPDNNATKEFFFTGALCHQKTGRRRRCQNIHQLIIQMCWMFKAI